MANDKTYVGATNLELNQRTRYEIPVGSGRIPAGSVSARRLSGWLTVAVCAFSMLGAACSPSAFSESSDGSSKAMSNKNTEVVYFDVGLKSYLERPIFDVYIGGQDIGLDGGQPHGGPGGLMTGVPMRLGPQTVTWRLGGPKGMVGNGDTVTAINRPLLTTDMTKHRYLGVHIYPDNTVELVPDDGWPDQTERGEEINRQWKATHGQ